MGVSFVAELGDFLRRSIERPKQIGPEPLSRHAELTQELRGNVAWRSLGHGEQHVLRAEVTVSERNGFIERTLQNLLGATSEGAMSASPELPCR